MFNHPVQPPDFIARWELRRIGRADAAARVMWYAVLMNTQEAIDTLRQHERALRARGVAHAALFGSVARGDNRPDSDIDILIEFDPEARVTVFDYVGLKNYIGSLFVEPVDVIDREAAKAAFAPAISDECRLCVLIPTGAALDEILHHIALAQHFCRDQTLQSFCDDVVRMYAVTRCPEIISEASRRLSDALKKRHPSIAWRNMAGAGNIYRHDYEDAAATRVWETV